jgi:HD-GYP domain-containing protein (c-di-GMP phosphodiesterase class II)/DNA-binding CsgD family transcriptional regulator
VQSNDLRLAELLAALSRATDVANGYSYEKSLKNCLLAAEVAQALGLEGEELADTYYCSLLRYISCTAFAHEESANFGGDDIAFRNLYAPVDLGDPAAVFEVTTTQLAKESPPEVRARAVKTFLEEGAQIVPALMAANCDAGQRLAARLWMSPGVIDALGQIGERWDGLGAPGGLRGEEISMPARIMHLVHVAVVFHQVHGVDAACQMVRQRSGSQFDPAVAEAFLGRAATLLGSIEPDSVWEVALAVEPEPRPWIPASRLQEAAKAFADVADHKSPFTLGHSSAAAKLGEAAARQLSLGDVASGDVYLAGLLHDLGRVSVPNSIWEKPAALNPSEWERVRLHPYHTERILSQCPVLHHVARLASCDHERLDGHGYHRGLPAAALTTPERVLAAADAYQAMIEERPHRPRLRPADAARELRSEVKAGRLDREAVGAVLDAAGQPIAGRGMSWPAGLSGREVEVLRLVAKGHAEKAAAEALFISEQTVHQHVKHIYEKTGVSSRAGVALFAMEHDLIRT